MKFTVISKTNLGILLCCFHFFLVAESARRDLKGKRRWRHNWKGQGIRISEVHNIWNLHFEAQETSQGEWWKPRYMWSTEALHSALYLAVESVQSWWHRKHGSEIQHELFDEEGLERLPRSFNWCKDKFGEGQAIWHLIQQEGHVIIGSLIRHSRFKTISILDVRIVPVHGHGLLADSLGNLYSRKLDTAQRLW